MESWIDQGRHLAALGRRAFGRREQRGPVIGQKGKAAKE